MNDIHPTATIDSSVRLGRGNIIGPNVVIGGFKDQPCDIVIGNGNVFHENVRILVAQFTMGDNCVIHNHVSFMAGEIEVGDDCWFGQYAVLDGTGGLMLEDYVAIGYHCYVWTHAGHSKLLPGSRLINTRPTIIRRGAWMIGCNVVVSPGVVVAEKTVMLPNCVVTKDTREGRVYGGIPARELSIEAW